MAKARRARAPRVLFRLVFLFAAFAAGERATAASVDALFEAEVEVADQHADTREKAFRDALGSVLVRVTGERDIAGRPELEGLLERAADFTRIFRYRRESAGPGASGDERLMLWVRFDGKALEKALRERGLPFWGRERPRTLVWLAVRRDSDRAIVDNSEDDRVAAILREHANLRGLPLVLPLMDTEDRRNLAFGDIWGGFEERVRQASERYAADAILIGRVAESGGQWLGRWQLLQDDRISRWQSGPVDFRSTVADGVHGAADLYAARFAIADTGGRRQTQLIVEAVDSLEGYARVMDYLAGLTPVESVRAEEVSDGTVTWQVVHGGTQDALENAISLGRTLERIEEAPRTGSFPQDDVDGDWPQAAETGGEATSDSPASEDNGSGRASDTEGLDSVSTRALDPTPRYRYVR